MITVITISIILLSISSTMLLAISPLSIGIIILVISVMLTLIFSSLISSWIAFLIFLIYVRGILVIFAYFVSLIPNQHTNIISLYVPFITSVILIIITSKNIFIPNQTKTLKFINTFYSENNSSILIILAIALLLAIVVVVKIVTSNKGPLRPFINYV